MATVAVPYHLDERLDGFDVGMVFDHEVTVDLPPGGPWQRMAVLYEQVAQLVSGLESPIVVISGDCTTSLGTLAGLQRAGHDVGIVWIDAHADFHTADSTTSGYLGGLPLALAAGVGTLTLPAALGLRSVPIPRIVLVDARDTDPGEHVLLDRFSLVRTPVQELVAASLPAGELYLHIDVDICDPQDVPDLRFPAPGGPTLDDVLAAVRRVVASGRVVAVDIGVTAYPASSGTVAQQEVVGRMVAAAGL